MSDLPTCSVPTGGKVTLTIPPGWYTYVSGLARLTAKQMIRMSVTNSEGTNTEYLGKKSSRANEMMAFSRTMENSYVVCAREDEQKFELAPYYATTNTKLSRRWELEDLEAEGKAVHGLTVSKAETPKHLRSRFPNYVTFFVFVQASADQKATETAPLFNDAVCTINLVKGTGVDHNGIGDAYKLSVGNGESHIPSGLSSSTATMTGHGDKHLDLVFVQNCTDLLQHYIDAAAESIIKVSTKIASSANLGPDALRLRLIGFRDHGEEFVTKEFPFTTDLSVMSKNLGSLISAGGHGNYQKAVTEALDAALDSEWRKEAAKMVVLVTDAPPHGVGEAFLVDRQPNGSPSGKDPLQIARQMASRGITLHVVACEPGMSDTSQHVIDFYRALAKITGGLVYPLVAATGIADYLTGTSLECLELHALVTKDGKEMTHLHQYGHESVEDITQKYFGIYSNANVMVNTLEVENIYTKNDAYQKTVNTYIAAAKAIDCRFTLDIVQGPRLLKKFEDGTNSPTITLSPKAISGDQIARVVNHAIARNSEVQADGQIVARPTNEAPKGNCLRINIPPGWYGFVTGISRAKYNQTIRLGYNESRVHNKEHLSAKLGAVDDLMRCFRTKESFYVFAATRRHNIVLETEFFWTRNLVVRDEKLDEPQYASQKLKVIQTETPDHCREGFPDYITYFIMAEDQGEQEQTAGVPDFNDCIGIVTLIRDTLMVMPEDMDE